MDAPERYLEQATVPPGIPAPSSRSEQFDELSLDDDKSSIDSKHGEGLRSSGSRSTTATESNAPASRQQTPLGPSRSHFSHISQSRSRSHPNAEDAILDVEKQTPSQPAENDPNLIDWSGPNDPSNPQNFPLWRKWLITLLLGSVTFCITFASSVFSTATVVTAQKFGVSNEVMVLGTSLFVLGFAVGPIVWGPLSELYGRKYPMFVGFFVFAVFQIPVAVAQNLQTVMVCRFFGGVFGSAPLGIVGGQLTDFWGPLDRGVAMTIFAGATFLGPGK